MTRWSRFWLSITLILTAAVPVAGQQTRQELIEEQRRQKAASLEPPSPNKFESTLFRIENDFLIERILNPPRGFYPRLGGLGQGAGFGAGPGYRFSNQDVDFRVSGAYSTKSYWIVETRLIFPYLAGGHLVGEVYARRRDYPQEDFFGLGPDSSRDERTNFALRDSLVNGALAVRVTPWLAAGGRVEFLAPSVGRGTDSRFPSTEELFTPAEAPGLDEQPDFTRYEGFISVDYSDPPLNPNFGGRYRLAFSTYRDRDFDRYSFERTDVDLQQYIPFLLRTHSFALRARVSLSDPDDGQQVPFYLQETLGGPYTLRGFRTFRFRDNNLLLLQAEYRWEVNALITGALFYDAGKVTRRRRDLDFEDLESDYGIGIRFGTRAGVNMRFDVAFGSGEGTRYLLRFDNVF